MRLGARGAAWLAGSAGVIYTLDRISKVWAERHLQGRSPIELLPGIRLTYTTNSGGAFSLGQSAPWLFVGASAVVALAIAATAFRHGRMSVAVSLGLVLGGALGNLTDRLVRGSGLRGHVIDFIDVGPWPVFNVADSAIVVGALLLGIVGLRAKERPQAEPDDGD